MINFIEFRKIFLAMGTKSERFFFVPFILPSFTKIKHMFQKFSLVLKNNCLEQLELFHSTMPGKEQMILNYSAFAE